MWWQLSILITFVFCSNLVGGDKCFCPVDHSPPPMKQQLHQNEVLFQEIWNEVISAIPITPTQKITRKFSFVKNWPSVPTSQKQTITTQTLYINQNTNK